MQRRNAYNVTRCGYEGQSVRPLALEFNVLPQACVHATGASPRPQPHPVPVWATATMALLAALFLLVLAAYACQNGRTGRADSVLEQHSTQLLHQHPSSSDRPIENQSDTSAAMRRGSANEAGRDADESAGYAQALATQQPDCVSGEETI